MKIVAENTFENSSITGFVVSTSDRPDLMLPGGTTCCMGSSCSCSCGAVSVEQG